MNSEQRELFRGALLRVLDERASDRFGLGAKAVQGFLPQHGFRGAAIADIEAELLYHADKGLVAIVGKKVSPENTCWRITADGRDYVASGGSNS